MAKKTLGRKKAAPAPAAKAAPAPKARRAAPAAAQSTPPSAAKKSASSRISLTDGDRALLLRLATRTGLSPAEILQRALKGYAAAVAPDLPEPAARDRAAQVSEPPLQRLFISVDGKPEIEVDHDEFVLGSGAGVDLRLDLPLISEKHARILVREGRHLFEDLHSARGSFQKGERVDVRFLETGDEIDLGGFLPVRFRLEESL